jgi:hypothetical protein
MKTDRADGDAEGRWWISEIGGAAGDLGTLLPLTLAAVAVGGLAPGPVLAGFGAAYLMVAAVYRLPVPIQPMKAIVAMLVGAGASPESVAVAGVMLGAALLALGASGVVGRLERVVPQSALLGLQLGLGAMLAVAALRLMASDPILAAVTLCVLGAAARSAHAPAALLALAVAVTWGAATGGSTTDFGPATPSGPVTWSVVAAAASDLAAPQLALTIGNAVLLTALVARDCFGDRAAHVTPRRLATTSGLANLVLAPLGALPMCHGAGGLVAHHRFGARGAAAPALLGIALIALAAAPDDVATAALQAVPSAGLGALLFVAALDLMVSRRLRTSRPSCWPVIAIAAAATLLADPLWGLLAGVGAEAARKAIVARRGASHALHFDRRP